MRGFAKDRSALQQIGTLHDARHVIFDDDTPYAIIKALKPDVLVTDGDWGEDAIVGAGSVVTRNVPARTVVAGNPATVRRPIERTA